MRHNYTSFIFLSTKTPPKLCRHRRLRPRRWGAHLPIISASPVSTCVDIEEGLGHPTNVRMLVIKKH